MPSFIKKSFAKKTAAIAGILLLLILIVPYLVDINDYKGYIEERIGETIGHKVSIKKLRLYIGLGIGVQGVDFTVYSRDSNRKMFSSPKVVLYLSLKELLLGQIEVKSFSLARPEMTIIKNPKGKYNIVPREPPKPPEKPAEKKKTSLEKQLEFLNQLTIDKFKIGEGRLDYIDRTDSDKSFSIRRIFITLSRLKKKKGFLLYTHLLAAHPVKGKIGKIELNMEISGLPPKVEDFDKVMIDGDFQLKNLDFSIIKPFWPLPWIWLEKARINLEGSFKGQPLGDFELKAELKGKEVEFAYPEIFSDYLPADEVSVDVGLTRKGEVMDVLLKGLRVNAQRITVDGYIDLTDVLRDSIAMDLDLKLSPFNANFARKYIPYPVIPESVNRFIRDSVPHGIFWQTKVKLKGTIDEIADITVPGNQGVLAVYGLVMDGVATLPDEGGEITDIDGKVLLSDGKITFENVSGLIGKSPLKIPYFQIDKLYQTPVYDLKANLEIPLEHQFVKKHLLPGALADSSPEGSGALSLEARGTWNDLTASGLLNLNQCAYSYPPWFRKPKGQPNEVRFDLSRQGDWVTFSTLRLKLGSGSRLVLDNTRIDQKQHLIMVNPSQVAGADLLQNSDLRVFKTLNPAGKLSLKGRISLQNDRWEISGDLDSTKLEYHYPPWFTKPAGVPNECRFSLNIIPEKSVDLSRLKFKLENSRLDLSGSSFMLAQDRFQIRAGGRLSGDTYRKYLTVPVDFFNDLNPKGWAGINLNISKEAGIVHLTGDLDLKEFEYKYKDIFFKKKGVFNTCRLEFRFPKVEKTELSRLELLMDHGSLEINEGEFSAGEGGSGSLPIKIRLDHQLLQTNLKFPWLREMDPEGSVTARFTLNWTKESSSVTGNLDLTGLDYHYENYLKKPAGLSNRMEYDIRFPYDKPEIELKKVVYQLNGDKTKVQIVDSKLADNQDTGSLRLKAELDRKSVAENLFFPIFEELNLTGVLRGEARLDWSPSAYRMAGMFDLTGSDYRYDSYLVKPSGVSNRLNIDLLFPKDREDIELKGLEFRLTGSSVKIVDNQLDLKDLQKGSMLLKIVLGQEAADNYLKFPFLKELHLRGETKGKVNIDWNPSGYRLAGALDLTGAGYRYRSYLVKPLRLSNKIDFAVSIPEKNRYKISQLGYYINRSLLGVSGTIDNVSGLEYELAVGARAVELSDIFPIIPPEYAEKIISMEGVGHLQASLKKSPEKTMNTFNFKLQQGKISLKDTPVSLYRFNLTGEGSDEDGYRLEIASGSGGYRELPLENINASAFYNPSQLSVSSFTAKVSNGFFSGKATIQYDRKADNLLDETPKERDKYQIEVSLIKADAGQFLRGLRMGSYKKISGSLSFSGYFTNVFEGSRFSPEAFASQELYQRLKKDGIVIEDDQNPRQAEFSHDIQTREELAKRLDSARYNIRKPIFEVWGDSFKEWSSEYPNGNFKVSLKNGRIKGYATLNRVLYFVNPDGLVKSRQEDFGKDSYPYKSIKGSFKVENGISHTDNLLLDSNSWKILVLGDIDYPKEKLDLRLFVQPLRMIDSVLDSIPLVGRVVKEKNRGLIEACFKVKGPYQDPEVSSIQMQNLMDKTFGILGRFFTLPMNLIKKTQ